MSSQNFNVEYIDKFNSVTKKLRCVVCQNQNLYESDAKIARMLKLEISTLLEEGLSENEILNSMEQRYGEFILYEPKISMENSFLWGAPIIFLTIALFFLIKKINKVNFK